MSFDAGALLKEFDSPKLAALVETMVLAADADGEVTQAEIEQLLSSIAVLVRHTPAAAELTKERVGNLLRQAQENLARDGRARRIESVKRILADAGARKAALGLAIKVTAADGIIRTSERELIYDLAEGLEVDRDDAADLVRELTRG